MSTSRPPCCGLALLAGLSCALTCQPLVPAVQCSDDSDCPADFLCESVRRFCFADSLARDDWRADSADLDAALDAGRDGSHDAAHDGAAGDRPGTDRARVDGQLADIAPSDRRILDFSVSTDSITGIDVIVADLPKTDRAGGPDNGAIDAGANNDAGANTDAGRADACACVIDGGCLVALAPNPTNSCLWCDPLSPDTWSDADGEVCWGNLCTGARLCVLGACGSNSVALQCTVSCNAILQRCCGEPGEPCCDAASTSACTTNSYCDYGMTPPICRAPTCGAAGQVCCSNNVCNPGMACEIGPQICQPCGPNQQFCCDGVNCGADHVCDEFAGCSACGRTNQLCCPDLTCNNGAPACCQMVWPPSCIAQCE